MVCVDRPTAVKVVKAGLRVNVALRTVYVEMVRLTAMLAANLNMANVFWEFFCLGM